MIKAEYVVRAVKDAYAVLHAEEDLSPNNPRINATLDRLVKILSEPYTPEQERRVLLDHDILRIRRGMLKKLAGAESAMEKFWSEKFCEKPAITDADMKGFWYWQNYSDLVAGEARHFPKKQFKPDETIAFVGSGPLPLTAILLNRHTGKDVTCIDIDPAACHVAEKFLRKAGLGTSIKVVCSDGADYNFKKHPIVLIASLVPNKEDVLTQISKSEQPAYVGLRSAERLHTLLYDPVQEDSPELSYCRFSSKTVHDPKIINTTLFYHSDPGWHMNLGSHVKKLKTVKYGWGNVERPMFLENK